MQKELATATDDDIETMQLSPRGGALRRSGAALVQHQATFIATEHGIKAVEHHRHQSSYSIAGRPRAGAEEGKQSTLHQAFLSTVASFFFIFRLNTVAVSLSGIGFYWFYDHEEWGLGMALNIPFTIVTFGVFFPLGFVIGAVYRRRDQAALVIAALKASALGLVMMARDWDETFADGLVGANSAKPHPVALTDGRSAGRGRGGALYVEMRAVLAHFLDQVFSLRHCVFTNKKTPWHLTSAGEPDFLLKTTSIRYTRSYITRTTSRGSRLNARCIGRSSRSR